MARVTATWPKHVWARGVVNRSGKPVRVRVKRRRLDLSKQMAIIKYTSPGLGVTNPDTGPDQFTFVDQTGVELSTLVESAPVQIAGFTSATITVSGTNNPEYQINGGAYTNAPGTIINLDNLRVRHTSSAFGGIGVDTLVTIGGVSDTFTSITTGALLQLSAIAHLGSFTLPAGHQIATSGKGKDADTIYCGSEANYTDIGVVTNPGPGGGEAALLTTETSIPTGGWVGIGGDFTTCSGFYYYAPTDRIFYVCYQQYTPGAEQFFSIQALDPSTFLPIGSMQRIGFGLGSGLLDFAASFGEIPAEWQASLGGDMFALSGPTASEGVSLKSFNGADVDGSGTDISAFLLTDYPILPDTQSLFGSTRFGHPTDELANTVIQGGAFVAGTRTFIAWGAQGLGQAEYGTAPPINDPCNPHQGIHTYPYECAVFLFDIDDLVDSKNGVIQPYEPVFYNRLDGLPDNARGETMPGPAGTPGQNACFSSYRMTTWFDPATFRIYVADNFGATCHVYQVTP